jgi:hypothetical protein
MISTLILASFLTLSAYAADEVTPAEGAIASPVKEIVLGTITWDVDGITRPWALRDAAEIDGDERFPTRMDFDRWVQERRQLLYNQRALASVEADTTVGEADASGIAVADITFHVKDTWNVVALPYPKYDTNDGLVLSIKARNYNFLGTLQPLRFDIRYELEPDYFSDREFNRGTIVFEIDSTTPFRAFGQKWEFDFDHYIGLTYKEPVEYENTTGVALLYPIGETELKVGMYHGISVNQKNDDEYIPTEGERFADVWYMSDALKAYWTIPIRHIPGYGDLKYVPRGIFNYNYRPGGDIGDQRRGPTVELGHALTLGQVDWVENFRKGIVVSLDNANVYNLDSQNWERTFIFSAAGHKPIGDFAGVSSRFTTTWHLDKPDTKAGVYLRGVVDESVQADYAAYINMDLPVRVISFTPSKWWGRKWRAFDFEQHWSPFVDIGFLSDKATGTKFGLDDALVTGGLAVITYPLSWRALFIRISLGLNLRQAVEEKGIPGGDGRELFIGIGHEY